MKQLVSFLDKVKLFVAAGDGGAGLISFSRTSKHTPNGGNGGNGGNIVFKVNPNLSSLNIFSGVSHFYAEHGEGGGRNNCHGKNANDKIIYIPYGSVVYDETGELIFSTAEHNSFVVAQGGIGGIGNGSLMNSIQQYITSKKPATIGEKKWVIIDFIFPSSVSIVGAPASGKSTFLQYSSGAKIPAGSHGFKHDYPILGTVSERKFIDIPSINMNMSYKLKHILTSSLVLVFITEDFLSSNHFNYLMENVFSEKKPNQVWFVISKTDELSSYYILKIKKKIKSIYPYSKIKTLSVLEDKKAETLLKDIRSYLKKVEN